jgi:hypothetical protein
MQEFPYFTRLLHLAEVEELDSTPQDLRPGEVLTDDEERVLDRVLALPFFLPRVVRLEEVPAKDVVEP